MTPKDAVAFMLANKITSFKTPDGLEMTLSPEAFVPPKEKVKPDTDEGPNLDELGSAGQSRREQLELFGTTFENDFRRPETAVKKRK